MHQSQLRRVKPLEISLVMPVFLPLSNLFFALSHLRKFFPLLSHLFFYFIRFTTSGVCFLSESLISSGFNGITTGFRGITPSYNCLSYFIIYANRYFTKQLYSFHFVHLHKHQIHRCLRICMCILIIRHLRLFHCCFFFSLHTHTVFHDKF